MMMPWTFASSLFSGRSIKTGHLEIDGRYRIRGDAVFARRTLRSKVREALLTIAKRDVPTLFVRDGLAWINWLYEGDQNRFTAAVSVLRAVRKASVPVALLTPPVP
jgi:hypothetical protein